MICRRRRPAPSATDSLHCQVPDSHCRNLRGQSAIIFEARGNVSDIEFRFNNRLARIAAFQLRQSRQILPNPVCQPEQHAPALLCGSLRPRPSSNALSLLPRRHSRRQAASGACAITSSVEGSYTGKVFVDLLAYKLAIDEHLISLRPSEPLASWPPNLTCIAGVCRLRASVSASTRRDFSVPMHFAHW